MINSTLTQNYTTRVGNNGARKRLSSSCATCRHPSIMDSQIGPVGRRIAEEMRKLGFDEVRFDKMEQHLWPSWPPSHRHRLRPATLTPSASAIRRLAVGPVQGKSEDGIFLCPRRCDEKRLDPGMVYRIALARDLELFSPDEHTLYYFGNMEEWCDGITPTALPRPIPRSKLRFRGHRRGRPGCRSIAAIRGRLEMSTAKGKRPRRLNHLGDNAIYKDATIIEEHQQPGTGWATTNFWATTEYRQRYEGQHPFHQRCAG